MPVCRINYFEGGLQAHLASQSVDSLLEHAATTSPSAPIVFMIHGYSFRPHQGRHCPHEHIFSLTEPRRREKVVSWPKRLGISETCEDAALAVAFGWDARGPFHKVYQRAKQAGRALADAVRIIHAAAPNRPIYAIGHSLGARVILQSLLHLELGAFRRIILLNPAEYRQAAEGALEFNGHPMTETLIVTSGENRLFDLLMARLSKPEHAGDRPWSQCVRQRSTTYKLQIDCDETLAHLAQAGFPITRQRKRFCHWSPYLRDGTFGLYQALIEDPERTPLSAICASPLSAQASSENARWHLVSRGYSSSIAYSVKSFDWLMKKTNIAAVSPKVLK